MTCKDHIADDERLPYMAWHPKAHESHRKGEKQRQCSECGRWIWPWEMR